MGDVGDVNLDSKIVAERIADMLERFGTKKFKGVGHRSMDDAMKAGALGIEIIISGKIPGSRAKSWRFYQGYLKKCGDIALTGVSRAHKTANLKSGNVGIKVRIMPPTTKLLDRIEIGEKKEKIIEEVKEAPAEEKKDVKEQKQEEPQDKEGLTEKKEEVEKKDEE